MFIYIWLRIYFGSACSLLITNSQSSFIQDNLNLIELLTLLYDGLTHKFCPGESIGLPKTRSPIRKCEEVRWRDKIVYRRTVWKCVEIGGVNDIIINPNGPSKFMCLRGDPLSRSVPAPGHC